MPRRFNYTGRQRIRREHARIHLLERPGGMGFRADLSLADYALPPEAPVIVEAYRRTTRMHFDFGRAGRIITPENTLLTEFESPEVVLFRVRVTDSDGQRGRLLAVADKLRPRAPSDGADQASLLAVRTGQLNGEVWTLEISESSDWPCLVVDEMCGSHQAFAQHPMTRSLIYPAILRMLLTRIMIVDGSSEDGEEESDLDDWPTAWMQFARQLPGVGPPPARSEYEELPDEALEWIDRAVESFSRRLGSKAAFEDVWAGAQD